ncbi:MAG: ABC transporter substrate-binding protein, partial [Gammaproteobacteria bacterium]|nr:ABC transporter substrate-binding protein [Gammaproteobacteria bacterium]
VERVRAFDFDMMVHSIGQSESPGNEQRDFWHSANADVAGSRNVIGIKDPVVDALIDKVIQAPDRQSLVHRTRALDRVLLWGHYVIPQWHLSKQRIAYWAHLQRPTQVPRSGVDLDTWWVKP